MQPEPVSAEIMKVRSNGTLALAVGKRQQRFGLDLVDLVEDQDLGLADILQPFEDGVGIVP